MKDDLARHDQGCFIDILIKEVLLFCLKLESRIRLHKISNQSCDWWHLRRHCLLFAKATKFVDTVPCTGFIISM